MSAFTESALLKKLQELNSSQQSIQTLSLWLIHHRKHHQAIIKTWYRELQNVPESKKLTFMYLANDVIQNSKKKGPEYGREFGVVLQKVFAYIGENCSNDKLFGSLGRILNIWEERGVYDNKLIADYRAKLNKVSEPKESAPPTKEKDKEKKLKRTRSNSGSDKKEKVAKPEEGNGVVTEIDLSPHLPLGDPPEPEELIKALMELENSASSDAIVRERIANLPPEISEITCLAKLEDKDAAKALATQVNEAVQLLNEYNTRLASEMEERTKLTTMLRDFQAEQKELLAQAEERHEEYSQKLLKLKAVQKELHDHLSNLPDLTQLPDVTGGLAPLPSAGDLFNIH
ncbi:regulation of nuclear pre-mRNA domain-containing protein 1B [Episyrphus balteatus]|uniref:regulation of nuclear pre-mRNA domain-containing protein 1B n=1 Tax=Episyrphus balteatus TaxID=286459 RepID=UPI00248534A4|nr:regulation of nuclear pre-mRNA domain-containing protein 1B [Episyrphus balteatus]